MITLCAFCGWLCSSILLILIHPTINFYILLQIWSISRKQKQYLKQTTVMCTSFCTTHLSRPKAISDKEVSFLIEIKASECSMWHTKLSWKPYYTHAPFNCYLWSPFGFHIFVVSMVDKTKTRRKTKFIIILLYRAMRYLNFELALLSFNNRFFYFHLIYFYCLIAPVKANEAASYIKLCTYILESCKFGIIK